MDGFLAELLTRALKYLIEGLAVGLACYFIPRKGLPMDEIATVALSAAFVFAILDALAPAIGVTSRQGSGFFLGARLAGF